jgi:hypothetical protein
MAEATGEFSAIVREAAEPREAGDSVKAAIGRAARRLGLSHGRARGLWYGDARVAVRADEADRLRAAYLARLGARDAELRAEIATVRQRQDYLAALLRRRA